MQNGCQADLEGDEGKVTDLDLEKMRKAIKICTSKREKFTNDKGQVRWLTCEEVGCPYARHDKCVTDCLHEFMIDTLELMGRLK